MRLIDDVNTSTGKSCLTCSYCEGFTQLFCSLHDCSITHVCDDWTRGPKNNTTQIPKNPFHKPQQGGSHYRKGDTMDVAEWCERREHTPCQMNVVKYVDRHKDKGGIKDLRKARQYLEFLAWVEYGENL